MGRSRFVPDDDEDVLLETGPHWLRLVPRLFPPALLVAAAVAAFVGWSAAPVWFAWVLLGAFVVAGTIAGGRFLSWRSTTLVVTTSRIVHREGVLRRTGREIPISRVQDVSYRQSLLERLVGIGLVVVESAGSSSAVAMADVPHPAEVQRLVNRTLEAAARPGGHAAWRRGVGDEPHEVSRRHQGTPGGAC